MSQAPAINDAVTWVYTDDLDATCAFYSGVLELKLWRDAGVARIFELRPSTYVGVCLDLDWRVVEPRGSMLTLVTDDVDGWYARLTAANARCKSPPERNDKFGIYAFLVEDPNGYLIEFQQFLDR
ncbi:MAG: VOC family protein [Pseudomonadota bacterium]